MLTNIIARPYDAVTFPHLNGIKNYTQVVLVWLLHSESEKKLGTLFHLSITLANTDALTRDIDIAVLSV